MNCLPPQHIQQQMSVFATARSDDGKVAISDCLVILLQDKADRSKAISTTSSADCVSDSQATCHLPSTNQC